MRTGAVLLAGGKSLRMGCNKAELQIAGQSFLERIANELLGFAERLLSVGNTCTFRLDGFTAVQDIYPGCGPMGGLHAALVGCQSDELLVVTCDVPLFKCQIGEYLVQCLTPDYDAVVAVTRDGCIHPFCGVYRKEMADLLEKQISEGQLCMRDAMDKMQLYCTDLTNTPYSDNCLANINTPDEYAVLLKTAQEDHVCSQKKKKKRPQNNFAGMT